jgi:hypothetical protein
MRGDWRRSLPSITIRRSPGGEAKKPSATPGYRLANPLGCLIQNVQTPAADVSGYDFEDS